MQAQRIRLTALLTLIATLTPTWGVHSAASAFLDPLLTQTATTLPRVLVSQAESQYEAAERLRQQGDAQLERQELQAAIESYQQAILILQELKENNITEALKGLAKAYLLLEDYPQAIALFQQLVEQARAGKLGLEPALSNLGLALFQSGQLSQAEQVLREAIAGWEARREKEDNELNKITILEQQAYTYRLLQKVLVAQDKTDEALLIAEQIRARSLVEQLVETSGSQPTPPPTIEQIKQIARTSNSTLVEYSIVGSEVRVFGNEPTDETDLYIWVVKPDGSISFRQVDLRQLSERSLTQLVVKARKWGIGVRGRSIGVIETEDEDTRSPEIIPQVQLQKLYQLLIQPIAELLPNDTNAYVTFIPHGALFLVPFAALQAPSGKYFIEQHTPVSAPSIQVLALTNRQQQRLPPITSQGKTALIVGNPTMPSLPAQDNSPAQQLDSLPGAEREALSVASLLNTEALTGGQATKADVVRLMPQQRIIHLATHGLLDLDANFNELGEPLGETTQTARESGVIVEPGVLIIERGANVFVGGVPAAQALAGEKVIQVSMPGMIALAPSGGDNGFLTAQEILDLKLNNTELVVLSACDTGRGRITGEGVLGLSRAFIATGVPSAIVSLWAIPDAPTALLMTEFYRQLQQTQDKAQALRQAMLTTKSQYPDPKNWAAFILIGESK